MQNIVTLLNKHQSNLVEHGCSSMCKQELKVVKNNDTSDKIVYLL